MAVTMNRGEWSEAYAFLRLLAEGKLFAADENLNRIENMYFPIKKIIRTEAQDQIREYRTDAAIIRVFFNDTEMLSLPISDFCQAADELLDSIRSVTSKSRSFAAESSVAYFADIGITQLKAPSNVKADIKMEVHDVYTGIDRIAGFSIKSDLGAPPTLFNASNATNFVYEISGLNASDVQNINGIDSKNKIIDRMSEIVRCGGSLSFARVNNSVFAENLVMIDSQMQVIIDKM